MPGSPIQKVLAWVAPVRERKEGPESEVESVPIRRSARIPLSIPIIISAKDDLGRTFKETTRTIEVSKNGAKIGTFHRLALHADIAVANPAVGRTCLAKVTWRGPRRLKEPIEIGIELLESYQPERIWGLESPPDDWLRGPSAPTADQRLQYLCARDRTRPADFEPQVSPEAPEVLPTPVPAPDMPTGQPRRGSPGPDKRLPQAADLLQMSPTQVSERLGVVAEAILPLIGPKIEKSVEQSATRLTDRFAQNLEEQAQTISRNAADAVSSLRLAAQEALAKIEGIEASFETRAEAYQTRLTEATASAAEELRQRSEALNRDFQTRLASASQGLEQERAKEVAERIQQLTAQFEERSVRQLEQLGESMGGKLGEELKASGTEIVNEARRQLTSLAQASIESVTQKTEAASEEYRQRLVQTFEEHAQTVTGSTGAAVDSVGLARQKALADLKTTREQMEASLERQVRECQQRLIEVATSGVDQLEHKSDALLEGFQGQLQSTLESFQEKGTKEVADQLQRIAAELQGRSAEYLKQQAAATVDRLSQELRNSGAAVVGETEQRLANLRQASVQSLVQQTKATAEEYRNRLIETFEERAQTVAGTTQAAVESVRGVQDETAVRLEHLRQQMEAGLQTSAALYENRLTELATSGVGELERKSAALLEGFQGQLQSTLESFEQKGTKEVADRLQTMATEMQGRSAQYLEQQAAATLKRLSQQLTDSGKGIAEAAQKQLASLTEGSLESLNQEAQTISGRAREAVGSVHVAGEEAVARLEATQQKIAATFELGGQDHEKRLAALAASGMEALEHKADLLDEKLGEQGAQIARSFHEQAQAALDSTAAVASSVQLTAEGAVAKLQTTRQQMEGELETAVQVHRQRLVGLANSSVEGIQLKSDALLGEIEKHSAQLAQTFQEQTRVASSRADADTQSIRLAAEQAVAGLQTNQQKIESGFETRANDHQKRLTQLLASGIEGLEQRSSVLAQSFEGRLEKALDGFKQKGAQDVADQLRIMAAELEEHAASQIEQRTTATLQRLNEKLTASGTAVTDQARRELASVTQMSLESVTWATAKECRNQLERIFREQSATVSGAANEAVKSIQLAAEQTLAKLQTVEQKLEVSFESNAGHYQKQLTELVASSSDALQRTSNSLVEGFQGRLKNSLRVFEEKSGKELEGVLEKIAAGAREQSVQQLRKHGEETERKLKEGLTASGVSVVEEARRLGGITHQALETLSQAAAEECRKSLDEFKQKTDAMRKHVGDVAGANVEKLERDLMPAEPKRSWRTLIATAATFLALAAPALTAVYLSTRPVMRLRTEPPAEFLDVNPNWNAKRRAAEEQLARAYWDSAAQNVQGIYRFGMDLPDDPPAAFKVDADIFASTGVKIDVTGSQTRYWQKLHALWGKPQAWEEAYGWHTDWFDSVSLYLQETVVKLQWKLGTRLQK